MYSQPPVGRIDLDTSAFREEHVSNGKSVPFKNVELTFTVLIKLMKPCSDSIEQSGNDSILTRILVFTTTSSSSGMKGV